MKPHFIQTFEDEYEIQKKAASMLSSAKQEILEIFSPSTDAYSNSLLELAEEHVVDSKEEIQQE